MKTNSKNEEPQELKQQEPPVRAEEISAKEASLDQKLKILNKQKAVLQAENQIKLARRYEEKGHQTVFSQNKFVNQFYHLCIWAAASDSYVLLACSRAEQNKHLGIGLSVFFVACLAFFSSSYAISTIFDGGGITYVLGLFWALMIFNLDRLLISSSERKKPYIEGSTGGKTWYALSKLFSVNVLVRLFLAVLMSVVISKPLELKILSSQIEKELLDIKREKMSNLDGEIIKIQAKFAPKIDSINQQKQDLTARFNANRPSSLLEADTALQKAKELLDKAEAVRNRSIAQKNAEINYIRSTSINDPSMNARISALQGQILAEQNRELPQKQGYETAMMERNSLYELYASTYKTAMKELDLQGQNFNEQMQREMNQAREDADMGSNLYKSQSLIDRMAALHILEEKNPLIWYIGTFLMIFFVSIELSPILVKLFMDYAQYDKLLADSEAQFTASHEILFEDEQLQRQRDLAKNQQAFEQSLALLENQHQHRLLLEAHRLELEKKSEAFKQGLQEEYLALLSQLSTQEERKLLKEWEAKLAQEIKLVQELGKVRMEQESLNNRDILKTISNAHLEVVRTQVEHWLKQEKKALEQRFKDDV